MGRQRQKVDGYDDRDPYVANSFGVIDLAYNNSVVATFTAICGGEMEMKVIRYTLNNNPGRSGLRIPGPASIEPITLSFGVTDDVTFWNWFTTVKGGYHQRVNLTIKAYGHLLAPSGSNKAFAQWDLTEAWPYKISGFNFDLDSSSAFIAEVTIIAEGISRVEVTNSPPPASP